MVNQFIIQKKNTVDSSLFVGFKIFVDLLGIGTQRIQKLNEIRMFYKLVRRLW